MTQCREEKLVDALNNALNWMEWIQRRQTHCTCEPNARCVKCVITKEITSTTRLLAQG